MEVSTDDLIEEMIANLEAHKEHELQVETIVPDLQQTYDLITSNVPSLVMDSLNQFIQSRDQSNFESANVSSSQAASEDNAIFAVETHSPLASPPPQQRFQSQQRNQRRTRGGGDTKRLQQLDNKTLLACIDIQLHLLYQLKKKETCDVDKLRELAVVWRSLSSRSLIPT
jgi:hypothetical protein